MLTLSITKPCQEKWESMTPVEQGAYCGSCCKNVIDFTGMPDEAILDYFQKKKGEAVCGRFRNEQLNRSLIEIAPSIFMMRIPFWKKFLAALFIYFSSFITGCSTEKEKDYTKIELPAGANSPIPAKRLPSKPAMPKSISQNQFEIMILGFVTPEFKNQYVPEFPDLMK